MKCGYNCSQSSSSFSNPSPEPENEFWTEDTPAFSSAPQQFYSPQNSSTKTSKNSFPVIAIIVPVLAIFGAFIVAGFQFLAAQQAEKNNHPKIDITTGYNTFSNTNSQDSEPQAQRQNIVSQAFTVSAGHISHFKFTIPRSVTNGTVVGNFSASGGGGNDIQVAITNETGLTNIKNSNAARMFYDSGKVTTDDINVTLTPGTYYIVFNNSYSIITPKAINADINVEY